MAKTFTLQSKNSYDGRYLKLTCTQVQNISTNKSTIKWKLESLGGSVTYYYTGPTTLTINGTQVYYKARTGLDGFPGIKGSVSGELVVSHNTDGSKAVSVKLSTAIYVAAVTSNSGTWTLDKIPRQATITAAPNFTDEQDPTITYSNPAGSAVSALDLCITLDGSTTNSLAYRAVSKTGTSYTYTLSDADREFLRNATPNSNTREVGFYLRTIIGGVEYYSKVWKTLTIVNAAPVLDPTINETNESVGYLTNGAAMLRHLSNAYFETGAVAQKGASITSQSVTCGGVTVEGENGTINGIQSGDFVITAVDSRGNTTTQTASVPFVEYVIPTCSIGNTKPDTDGNFTLTASGVGYTGYIPGVAPNEMTVQYRYKAGSGSYSSWQLMTVSLGDNAYTATAELTGLDYRTTYTFQCRAVDWVTYAYSDEVAIKAIPVFDWSGEDFNFNVPVSAPSLAVDSLILGGLPVNYVEHQDYVVEQGEKDGWTYRKWNSGIAECWKTLIHKTDLNTAWGSMYTATTKTSRQTYPFVFVSKPVETATLLTSSYSGWLYCDSNGNGVNSAYASACYGICRPTAATAENEFYISLSVKGRWKKEATNEH